MIAALMKNMSEANSGERQISPIVVEIATLVAFPAAMFDGYFDQAWPCDERPEPGSLI
jgi:hypothetical protein